jgi:hypothetical protein
MIVYEGNEIFSVLRFSHNPVQDASSKVRVNLVAGCGGAAVLPDKTEINGKIRTINILCINNFRLK